MVKETENKTKEEGGPAEEKFGELEIPRPEDAVGAGERSTVVQDPKEDDPKRDVSRHPFVRDDIRRVFRPVGQEEGRGQKYGQAFFQEETQTLAATDSIEPTGSMVPVAGSGGAVVLVSNPSIDAGVKGQILIIKGTDNTNTVTIKDGNGTRLVGAWVGGLNDTLTVWYDGSAWVESSRTNWVSSTTSVSTSSVSTSSSSSTTTP